MQTRYRWIIQRGAGLECAWGEAMAEQGGAEAGVTVPGQGRFIQWC